VHRTRTRDSEALRPGLPVGRPQGPGGYGTGRTARLSLSLPGSGHRQGVRVIAVTVAGIMMPGPGRAGPAPAQMGIVIATVSVTVMAAGAGARAP
jgi:hypothetical protein